MKDKCRKVLGPIFKTSALVAGLVSGYYHRVFAGDYSGGPNSYLLFGGADRNSDTTFLLGGAPLTVTTLPGFGIDTSSNGGPALDLIGVGGLRFTDSNYSSITGYDVGIQAYNVGGALVITTNGAVTGGAYGIAAYNYMGSDLSITAHNVSGGISGIDALNFLSTGSLTITTSGTVIGVLGDGIAAGNFGGTDLSISANNVYGGSYGIYALQMGSGRLTITTSGTVTGKRWEGITAVNVYGSATEITVGPDSHVRGETAGIYASSINKQPITITVNGTVSNLSGLSTDAAIVTTGGPSTINLNSGSLVTGYILLHYLNDTVTLAGTLDGSLYMENGNDTLLQIGSSRLTGTADGGNGNDTLGFNDVGTVQGSNYINFEHLAIYGGLNNLTGAWNFPGGSGIVYNGTLLVNGTLATPLVTVLQDGLLGGSGTVYGNVKVYGTLSPGNSIGTFKVDGLLDFMPGSTYEVVLAANGQSDQLETTGPVSISDSTLAVSLRRELYRDGTSWQLISAGGGIDGRFSSIRTNFSSSTLSLDPYYAGGDMGMVIHRTPYRYFGTTPNEREIADALNTLLPWAGGSMANLFVSMDFDMSPAQISATLNGLSPELYTSFAPSAIAAITTFSDIASFRQQETHHTNTDPGEPLWSVWGRAFGQRQNQDGDALYSGYTVEGAGLVLGADRPFGNRIRAGVLLGYGSSDLSWDELNGSGSISGKHIALYSSTELNNFYLDGRIGYTSLDNSGTRSIFTPVFSSSASADFGSNGINATLSGGYDFKLGSMHIGPVASFSYLHLDQDGFTDKGAGDFSVTIEDKKAEVITGSAGLRLLAMFNPGNWSLRPEARISLVQRSWDDAEILDGCFQGYPSAGFKVTGTRQDETAVQTRLGLTADYSGTLSLFLNGEITISDNQDAQLLSAGLVWRF